MYYRPDFTHAGQENTDMYLTFPPIPRWSAAAAIFVLNQRACAEKSTVNNCVFFFESFARPHNRAVIFTES
jgi:hypothetical protein